MGAIVAAMADLGYGVAYRVLDAAGFGVPQRRRRVVLVGHRSGDPRRAAEILLEPEGGGRDPRADRAQGPTGTGAATNGTAAPGGLLTYRKSRRAQSNTDDETWVLDDTSNTITGFDSGDVRTTHLVVDPADLSVRRLTPVEEERLFGFPDNWTAAVPESARSRQLGNAMVVPMAAWIFDHILSAA